MKGGKVEGHVFRIFDLWLGCFIESGKRPAWVVEIQMIF